MWLVVLDDMTCQETWYGNFTYIVIISQLEAIHIFIHDILPLVSEAFFIIFHMSSHALYLLNQMVFWQGPIGCGDYEIWWYGTRWWPFGQDMDRVVIWYSPMALGQDPEVVYEPLESHTGSSYSMVAGISRFHFGQVEGTCIICMHDLVHLYMALIWCERDWELWKWLTCSSLLHCDFRLLGLGIYVILVDISLHVSSLKWVVYGKDSETGKFRADPHHCFKFGSINYVADYTWILHSPLLSHHHCVQGLRLVPMVGDW